MVIRPSPSSVRGFTLVEAIAVMVITGIIASMVAVFIKSSIGSYIDAARRAELTEAADIALRKLTREVRLAVPNSLRLSDSGGHTGACSTGTCYMEFVPTKDGGRYRSEGDGSSAGNFLCTGGSTNARFDVLGIMPAVVKNDYIVVFNDASLNKGASCGTLPADIYCATGSRATVSVVGANALTTSAALANNVVICPYANDRFQVLDQNIRAVTYACPTAGAGAMTRYWNYGFNASQVAPAGGSSAPVVANATCSVSYTPNVLQHNGLLSVTLTLTDSSGEQIVAFREVHVDNAP
jgi:MSHA biogenesis protein MshO